jgi:hypothetical protein
MNILNIDNWRCRNVASPIMAWPLALDSGIRALGASRLWGVVAVHALAPRAWWGAAIPAFLALRAQQGAPLVR